MSCRGGSLELARACAGLARYAGDDIAGLDGKAVVAGKVQVTDTTNHYARANLETKRKALEQVDPTTKPGPPPRWRRDPELLTWLDSL